MSNKNLNLILFLSVFFLNILAMTPFPQKENEESYVFFPALLEGFGFKNLKREFNHQIPRLINSSQVYHSNLDRLHFAKSAFFVPGWADTRWQYRKNITIDHNEVAADLTNFPVYIELFDSDLQQDAQVSGNDIMFSDVTGSILDHEIELYQRVYNSSHARLIAWIKTNISGTQDTIISMYYGNPVAGNQENSISVWEEDYVGVWHMKEDPSGPSPQIMDSTSNNNDGTSGGSMTSDDLVTGQIDGSLDLDGIDDFISCGDIEDIENEITLSFWLKFRDENPPSAIDIVRKETQYKIYQGGGIGRLTFTLYTSPSTWMSSAVANLAVDTWYYVVGKYDGSNVYIYVNGSQRDSDPLSGSIYQTSNDLEVGRRSSYFNGSIDEVRISSIARSPNWIATEYNNQYNPSSFYSIGMKENYDSGDEWVIPMLRYRKNVTILASQVSGSGNLADFPVLVDLYDIDLHSTDKVQINGEDIVFTDVNGTKLNHEIEFFDQTGNGTHARLIVWVRVPSLSGMSNTTISMYYGNAAVGPQDNPEDVWDSNYAGVWHFAEATGGNDSIKDSTANNNDGTDYNNPTFGQTGKIYSAIEFDGTNQYLELPNSSTLENINEGDYTYEAWFYADQVPPGTEPSANDKRYAALIKNDPHCGIFYDHDKTFTIEHWLTGPTWTGATSAACNPQSYYHLVGVVSKTDGYTKLYVNGTLVDTNTWTAGTEAHDYNTKTLKFGIASPGASIYRWCLDGKLDEIRVSNSTRSANWISTEFNNQQNPNSFYLVEIEEEYRSWFKDASFSKRKDIIIDNKKVQESIEAVTLHPNGIGYYEELDPSTTGSDWEMVDEEITDDGDYVYWVDSSPSGTWRKDTYSIDDPAGNLGDINKITINVRAKAQDIPMGTPMVRTQIRTNSVDYIGDDKTLTTSYKTFSTEYIVNPYTGENWTWNEISSLEIGVQLKSMYSISSRASQVWLDISYNESENLSDFPILVDITSNDFKTSKIQSDASDLLFTDENGTKLFHEIEYFSQTSSQGHLIAWIEVNELFNNKDTLISMYYGNGELVSQESSYGVWSDSYVGVWHLSESSGDAKDSTEYDTHGTLQSGATQGVTGKIDTSYNFDGQNEGVRIGDPSDGHLDFGTTSFTISLWINVDQSTGTYQIPIYKGGTTSTSTGYEVETNIAATNLEIGISDGSTRVNNQVPISFDTWIHFTGVIDRITDTLRVYKNGVEVGTGNDISSIGDINNAYMMSFSQTSNPFDGKLDEIRISDSILSNSWIATEFSNQKDPSTFYTIGSETVFDNSPPEIIDFGVDDPGTGTGKFWADIIDSTSGVDSAEVTINGTEHAMSYNGTYWIYQSSVNFGFNYNYSITNASDITGNFLTSASSVKNYTFTYDAVAPDVLQWKYTTSTNTFHANVSDSWGEVDTVIVNVTSHSVTMPDPPTQIMDFYQDFGVDGLGYINDTLMMANGDIGFKIYVNDTSGNSFLSSSHPGVVWINHPPIAENLTLTPSPLYSNETLILNYDYYDEDNHGESGTEIHWYKNGILQASFNDSTQIEDTYLVPGDEWNVTVKPKDGDLFGEINSSTTVTILNTPPIVQSVTLLPATAYTTSTLSITNTTSDHENDGLSFYIEWYWNSQHNTSYDNLLTISPDKTIKGESWYCRIRAFDGTSNSSWLSSDPVIIQNTIPQAVNLTISPSTAYTNDTLVAGWDMFDADGDTENKSAAIIYWYKYGELQPLLNNCVSITPSNTSKDQSWFFRIQVFDGTDYSAALTQSGTRLISNSIPIAQNVSIIQSTPLTTDDLDAYWDYMDLDNDIEGSPLIKWYTNSSGSWQHEVSYNNYVTLPGSATTKGQFWCFGVQVYDQDDYAAEVNSSFVLILNTPPEISNLDLTSNPTTTNDLVATWESNDNDSDSLIFYVTWFLNGLVNTTLQTSGTSSTLTSENTTKSQEWSFNITAYDGETNSTEIALGYNITIQNSIPTVTNPTFNISSPVPADEGFNITYGFVDADGDSEVVTNKLIVYWYVNWEYNVTYVNYTEIDDIYTSTGEVWSYVIRVYDGEAYSANVSSVQGMTIGSRSNDPPYAENLTITPSTPKTHQTLIASYDYADNDSDPQYGYEIRWYLNGVVQSEFNNQLTIPASATSEGQNWNFSVKVFDGIVWGIYYNSSLYTIINSPPKVDTLDLTTSPTTIDDLVASWAFNDNDSDILTFNITWYLNGVLNSSWETTSSSTTLKAGNTTKNDHWSFSIYAFDGDEYSNIVSLGYNVTILNTVPVVGNLTITTNPTTTDDLFANWDYYDLDDDPRDDGTAFIVWYLNGESVGGLENTSSVLSGNTTKNQVWWYTIQGYDGQNYSLLQESQHVLVQNTAPINSSLLPIPTSPTVETGLVLTESSILTSLFDADGDTIQFITSIRWFKESNIQPDLNGSLTVSGYELVKGEIWYYTILPSDGLDEGSLCVSSNILIENSIPLVNQAYFVESSVTTMQNLTADYLYNDSDGESVNVSGIRWYRSTDTAAPYTYYLVPMYDGNLSLPYSATNKNERWKFDIKITDGYNESLNWILSDYIEIKNSKPWIDPFSISITGGTNTSDPLFLTYSWYDDDYPIDNQTGSTITWANSDLTSEPNNLLTLSSTFTKAGQRWWVTITPNDGEEMGTPIISWYYGKQIIIGNTPPVITEASIQGVINETTLYGTSFGTNFNLVVNYTVSDIDQDEGATGYGIILVDNYLSEAKYSWFRNRSGVVTQMLGLEGETSVPFYNTEKGDIWWVQICPRDLYGEYGLYFNSTQIIIGNTAPQILNLQWNQAGYQTGDNLSFGYDFFDFDTDDTIVDIAIRWYLNGSYNPLYDNQSIISSLVTKKDQNWSVECMVYDGEAYSTWFSLPTITIQNTLPEVSSIILTPFSPNTAETLMAAWNYSDIDGDIEQQARIRWYKNSVLQSTLNDVITVLSGNTSKNELWYYTIEVFDGETYSGLVTSPVITIINTVPTLEDVSFIMINPNTTISLEVDWRFLDLDGDTESTTVRIRWFKDGINQSALDDSRVVSSSFTNKGEVWYYAVQVFDGQNYSISYNSTLITIDNAIPSIHNFSYEFNQTQSQVEPDIRHTLTELVFYVEGEPITISYEFLDPDLPLDSDLSRIYWYYYDNSTQIWVEESLYRQKLTIPTLDASPGDRWQCVITPSDGLVDGRNITFPMVLIESKPLIHENYPVVSVLSDIEGHYELYLSASDRNNITTVEYQFNDSAFETQYAQFIDDVWFLEFKLSIKDFQNYLGTNLTGYIKVISTVEYGQIFEIYTIVPFSLEVKDEAPPRVENPYWKFDDELDPTNITFYADIIEYGSEISEVTLYYYFRPFEGTNISAAGIGAAFLQSDSPEWRMVHMALHNSTGGIPTFSITVPFDHNGTNREILYRIRTLDSVGNSQIAYDIERDDPDRIRETRFSYQPPGLPEWVLLIAGLAVFIVFVGSVVYVKFIRRPEIVGLDKELVLEGITKISEVEVMATLDSHTIGVVVSFFDQRHGPIPIIVIPELLKDNFAKLVDLSDRSFSGTGFCDDFDTEIPSSYDFVLARGLRTSVISFGYALERPQARGGQENLTCNILVHQDVFPLVESFKEEIKSKVHIIHKLMNEEASDKNKIRSRVISLRKFVSSVVLSYEQIYGTTELIIEE